MMEMLMSLRHIAPLLILAAAATLHAQVDSVPQLGDQVPTVIVKSRVMGKSCETGDSHRDPCAEIRLGRDRINVAWDPNTQLVTYLFSKTIITDTELNAGATARRNLTAPVTDFPGGIVSHQWCDTDASLTGKSLWCAVVKPTTFDQVKVQGFVQSVYLHLPPKPETPQPATSQASQHSPNSPNLNSQ